LIEQSNRDIIVALVVAWLEAIGLHWLRKQGERTLKSETWK